MKINYEKEIEQEKILADNLRYFFKGNLAAVKFCLDLTYILHLWDDLIDKDVERKPEEISYAFKLALIDLTDNPFYMKNLRELKPAIVDIILKWEDANILEKSRSNNDVAMAWMLRAELFQMFNYCAYLIGGWQWAKEVGPQMRRMYGEKLIDFLKEMRKCQTQ